jgi:UDPglucose 6-dehydrogenase
MRVTVIGTGYVGTVTGVCLAYLGHHVSCVDLDEAKIGRLKKGDVPIYEPFLAELLPLAAQNGTVEFTTDLGEVVAPSDVVFIAVGTPSQPSGEADLRYLESAARAVGRAMDKERYHVVVNKSTVPVGCGNLVEALVREGLAEVHGSSDGVRFGVASNPEFLREGSAIADSLFADRIVIGSEDERALAILRELYQPLVEQTFTPPPFLHRPSRLARTPLVTTTITSAEMIKYASNAFLAMKIGFANEMANICERVGADITEVVSGIGLDSRIGMPFLNAGIGWGGSCFGKDVHSLLHTAKEYGYHAKLLEASLEVNTLQRQLVIQKLQEKLYILKGRTVGLLGLAFKPNTDDLRDAPSLQIAERLVQLGVRVRVFDPIAMEACKSQHPGLRITYCEDALSVAEKADALVLVTEWPEFRQLHLPALAQRMSHAVLIDGRNLFAPDEARRAGFDYTGIGRAVHRANSIVDHAETTPVS